MSHPNLLDKNRTALLVVDVQEAFRKVIPDFDAIAAAVATAVRGFRILERPVFVTEQYPKGLGPTVDEIKAVLNENARIYEKTAFSSCGAAAFVADLEALGVNQVVICGLETHVCVNQTAHDLLDRGFQVHILTDCVCSRIPSNKEVGLGKMSASGVLPSSLEMAFFELMRDAKHEKFKEIQGLIK